MRKYIIIITGLLVILFGCSRKINNNKIKIFKDKETGMTIGYYDTIYTSKIPILDTQKFKP